MKKVIKLTESDLTNIIKRIVNESSMGRYKLPDGITMELINQYLNEENPNVLKRIWPRDHDVIKKLIKDMYIDGKPVKEIVKEYKDLAEKGELFPNDMDRNRRWAYQTETRILYLRKLFLQRLKEWPHMPTEEETNNLIKKREISQLKQSLYQLLSSYENKFTTDEINDILIDVRLNKNSR
jgi:hypothetical protein